MLPAIKIPDIDRVFYVGIILEVPFWSCGKEPFSSWDFIRKKMEVLSPRKEIGDQAEKMGVACFDG
ncbi:hypothetical protein Echvi_4226 [Echinicola vietnamensis DSM 17526]|uniref:Uncharacterized protein n=1 Tax=Echinicola vietnamensis (strain DSM 17526 / LMG 23754 / KMM 6221) TaxID=926556 RepID=L0G4G4_ECHVK|nr:hypothetical protein Echvi_4226 [Echinicola vietnamensis DSM 17526]